ncbi:hypothetical protein DSO57_1020229 [Entomophthora muscae]|uniref:Uncharacterized protein n=1 Tax=Entomophthora muscae TaxID=34485 RepID=A0ACC2ST78_9FUNG|nr:hypothetical protein DSO57_1020229 [Entomophthora muscae]
MEPPVTPKSMPTSAAELPLDHTNKLFGIVYITLTGVIDTIVPDASLWLWVGKSMSYLIKLAPILWWALPTQTATCQFPNTSELANQESLGYKWLFWIVLTTTLFTSASMGSRADLGTMPESQFLDSSWRCVIPGFWYTTTPLSNNPPVREETKVYGSTTQVTKPQVFCPLALAFLLCYLGAYFFLGCFNPLLGRCRLFGELFHLGMVSLPVGSLVTGLHPSAIIHHLGGLLPSGWVPDR